ncbi:MAG: amino acid permease [Chloroflexi bacterium]|nr:MAG: amino acid permease [Chloroflexota bacterium]
MAFVIDGLMGQQGFLDSPSLIPSVNMFTFIALATLVLTTIINSAGVRLVATLNNIGVATEILGMVVFALILLFFANHQSPAVLFDDAGAQDANNGSFLATFALGFFMSIFILYGFDTAGTFGEETVDPGRHAPRGVLSSVWISGIVGVVFLLAIILSLQGLAGGFPIATTITTNLTATIAGGLTVGKLYLVVILVSVFVCTLAIQGAATRMMFSMSRDRHLPLGAIWGHVNKTFRTPANAAVGVGVLAAIPILLVGPIGGITLSIAATGLIYLSYFLCNLGVAFARARGWPRTRAWFNLGRWGMPINILALLWGGIMIVNIGLWASPQLFGDFGGDGRAYWNPLINGLFTVGGQKLDQLPPWPLFETLVGILIITGAIYYAVAIRGSARDVEGTADTAPDAVIG